MAPASECVGCGKQWRTEHEPAHNREMAALLSETANHRSKILLNAQLNVMDSGDRVVHKPKFIYYETTPKDGFEDAEIVTAE